MLCDVMCVVMLCDVMAVINMRVMLCFLFLFFFFFLFLKKALISFINIVICQSSIS